MSTPPSEPSLPDMAEYSFLSCRDDNEEDDEMENETGKEPADGTEGDGLMEGRVLGVNGNAALCEGKEKKSWEAPPLYEQQCHAANILREEDSPFFARRVHESVRQRIDLSSGSRWTTQWLPFAAVIEPCNFLYTDSLSRLSLSGSSQMRKNLPRACGS